MKDFFHISYLIFLSYFLAVNTYYFVVLLFSWIEKQYRASQEAQEDYELVRTSDLTIPISVVIPAYNEESVILDSLYSVLDNGYPHYEVIVVNDGSTDSTLELLKKEFELVETSYFYRKQIDTMPVRAVYRSKKVSNLIVADKDNGGTHADAANVGLNLSRYRYTLYLDADTVLEKGAMLKAVRLALKDPQRVVGVGSLIGISNGFDIRRGVIQNRPISKSFIVNLQLVEYMRAFLVNRLAWSRGNFNICISGAFGLWRRDVLIEMGGFQKDFSCDDLEMTFRVHEHFRRTKTPYRIVSLPDPVCWTEAPGSTYSLYLQRHRWQRVTNETAVHYARTLFNPKYGAFGMLGTSYLWIAEVIGPWLEFLSYLLVPIGWALGMLSLEALGLFLLCSAGLTFMLSLIAIVLFDSSYPIYRLPDLLRLAVAASVEFLGYRQILSVAKFMGSIASFFGVKSWNKFEREKQTATA